MLGSLLTKLGQMDAGVRDLGIIALQKMENESKEDSEASELREQTGEKEWKRFQAKV